MNKLSSIRAEKIHAVESQEYECAAKLRGMELQLQAQILDLCATL